MHPPRANRTACPPLTAAGQLTALADGTLSAEEQAREFLRRHDECRGLNAFITVDADLLLRLARDHDRRRASGAPSGSLAGLLLCIKDNIHVAEMPNTAGTPALRNFRPAADADVVASLRAAGALFAGKTNMHELAFGITSANAAFGAVENPVAPGKFAGGSSGGTAAAIAAGLVAAGLGTDTGGSSRIPAALCGIVGFRPSTGRYSQAGVTPVSTTRDTIGLLANTVADVILLDASIAAPAQAIRRMPGAKMRLGLCPYFFAALDRKFEAVIDAALARLQAAGVELTDVELPGIAELMAQAAFPIALFEASRDLPNYLLAYATGIDFQSLVREVASPDVSAILNALGKEGRISAADYAAALAARARLADVYQRAFATHELAAMVMPATPLPARDIDGSVETVELNGERVPTFATYIRNTDPATIAAVPSLTLPAGRTADNLPVGLMLDGVRGRDGELLALGLEVERRLS